VATSKSRTNHGLANGYRSGLEDTVAAQLAAAGVSVKYEEVAFAYIKPTKSSRYTADFILPNGIVIETKGRFVTADRQKHKLIKDQHPNLDVRFVFSRSSTRLSKESKTTYAAWCKQYGFQWADKLVPIEWINEAVDPVKLKAIKDASK
jgi:hypothetical protein